MFHFPKISGFLFALASQLAFASGSLEIPANGSVQSGIAVISGWTCNATVVELEIDGNAVLEAAYGTTRNDTMSVCGDGDNGFGLLLHMGLLGTGEHTIVAYADGAEFSRSTFTVADIANGGFLKGASGNIRVPGFPYPNSDVILQWQEANQNFVIVGMGPTQGTAAAPTVVESTVNGTFQGWDGDTEVQLSNGQVWRQAEYRYEYQYAYRPDAIVYYSGGGWKMIVMGTDRAVRVTRIY